MTSEKAAPTYSEIRSWTYYSALRWATDHDGRLRRDRLQRIAVAKSYSKRWVARNAGERFVDVWQTVAAYHRERRVAERRRRHAV
jgi:hypothetical protein